MAMVRYCFVFFMMTAGSWACGQALKLNEFEEAFIKIIQDVRPCVVKITVSYKHKGSTRASSGIVLDREGHIVTVATSLRNCSKIEVSLNSCRKLTARLVGIDRQTNLAVLHVGSSEVTPVKKGFSDKLRVGALLITVGNPYGLNNSVSTGIVSGLHRCVWIRSCRQPLTGLIQTTAPINPGDDGGLVVDSQGKFVGMAFSTLKRDLFPGIDPRILIKVFEILKDLHKGQLANEKIKKNIELLYQKLPNGFENLQWAISSGQVLVSQGINFVLPSKTIYWVAQQIIEHGQVRRGWFGITVQDSEDNQGVTIFAVAASSPAAKCGLQTGDRLYAIDNRQITDAYSLLHRTSHFLIGQKVELEFGRAGQRRKMALVLSDFPQKKHSGRDDR